ncbi:hypothetical protein PG984_014027 [Apiospora sp. TS-2023a]
MAARDAYFPLIITFIILDSIAVGLRFKVRNSKGAVGYDDFAMLLSFVGFVLFGAMELTAVRHGIGAAVMEPTFDPTNAAKYFTIAAFVYLLASGVSKVGVGLVLYRLANSTDMLNMRRFLAWDLTDTAPGSCLPVSIIGTAGIVISAGDVFFTTVFAACVSFFYQLKQEYTYTNQYPQLSPVYMLRKVQIHFKLKLSILALLGLGLVSTVMTIIRLKYVITVAKMTSETGIAGPGIINITLEATIYSVLEVATSILAAAMTALRPLLVKLPCFRSVGSGGDSYPKHPAEPLGPRGPAYRLHDMATDNSGTESREHIVRHSGPNIRKKTEFEVVYGSRSGHSPQTPDW